MIKPKKYSTRTGRAGQTAKVSVSLSRTDLAILRKRAHSMYGDNLSAAVAEGVQRIREEEGREALVAWLRETVATPTPEQSAAIRTEWTGETARRRSHRAA